VTNEASYEKPETQRNLRTNLRAQRVQRQNSRANHIFENEERADGNRLDKKKAISRISARQSFHEELHAGVLGTAKS